MAYLGEFEEIVLLTVAALDGEGYGVSITREIETQTGRSVRLNQVHAALHRLEKKSMVRSHMGDATAERGGRRKRLFAITLYGQKTLTEIKEIRLHLWSLLPGTSGPATATPAVSR
ncbi:Transcriptional regulator PadR-like family protein [Catalinimonas alkaloidigena]|uniref:Transcriptional regulator PadR-like family protein n=1 Tax=Catalinimonas alkaloidigena TaxID=1075417 RepID=A0A1G9KG75_9BACT|nr:helix-turn-helix transcriptional regulator [Catalinimonas alkaloidigena]SDL48701.1 Transcriptional regulator PadR-like family protein [Catalinimonas alkaloidigena]